MQWIYLLKDRVGNREVVVGAYTSNERAMTALFTYVDKTKSAWAYVDKFPVNVTIQE